MSETVVTQPQVPNLELWSWLKLGQSSGKRSAEIVAGIRALTFPSPEAQALSSASGRWLARFLMRLNSDVGIANATGARQLCLTQLTQKLLTERRPPKNIVEMAAGFSARALHLARQFPQAKVVELDHPSVITVKEARLRAFCGDRLPKNLYWLSADLSATELTELLDAQSIDVVIAEGVFPYFPPAEITRIAAAVRACLVPQGIFITDLLSAQGWQGVEAKSWLAAWLLKQQVGRFKGAMPSPEAAAQLFQQAGYSQTAVHSLQTLSHEYAPHLKVADTSFLVAAHHQSLVRK